MWPDPRFSTTRQPTQTALVTALATAVLGTGEMVQAGRGTAPEVESTDGEGYNEDRKRDRTLDEETEQNIQGYLERIVGPSGEADTAQLEQLRLVQEGQDILRRNGIDPIAGPENLVWAPCMRRDSTAWHR